MQFSFKFIVLLIYTTSIFEYGFCQSYEGDSCSLSSGENGICKLISLCQSALDALDTQEIFSKTCGFKIHEPIVCCAAGSVRSSGTITAAPSIITISTTTETSTTIRIQTTPSTTTQKVNLKVGDRSRQKCKEYEKFVYQSPGIIAGLGGSSVPPIYDCPIVVVENIVGGKPAKPKEFPHMALVGFEDDNNVVHWDCGGSLISETFVLSAAHCTFHRTYQEPKYILLGELELNSTTDDAQPQRIQIKRIIMHPEYDRVTKHHDIALFELQNEPILNTYTRPACLNTNPTLTNRLGIASGWGHTSYNGEGSNAMLKVTLDMFTYADCKKSYKRENIKEEIQLCAGSRNESKDACQGDSGGPLQIRNTIASCSYNIIGVTSFGKDCGQTLPGIYTRVSAYIEWIEDNVWQ